MLAVVIWIGIFIASLSVLVKGADWLLAGAEKIGLSLGLSPFIVGVIIVGVGTSFPELVSSIAAVIKNAPEIVTANAVGSNIANIFLIVGVASLIGKRLVVKKDLIDLDLPLLAISTVLFLGAVYDGQITIWESLLLLAAYGVYLAYTAMHKDEIALRHTKQGTAPARPKIVLKDYLLLAIGIGGLVIGAKYLIDSVISLSAILGIGTGVISIIAVAVGTSLPELLVSIKAALQNNSEVALGNIFGSNVFNILVVIGLPGLFGSLPVDEQTLRIGVPTMVLATLLFVISGISRRIYAWEGAMYLLVYIMFTGKIFNLF